MHTVDHLQNERVAWLDEISRVYMSEIVDHQAAGWFVETNRMALLKTFESGFWTMCDPSMKNGVPKGGLFT